MSKIKDALEDTKLQDLTWADMERELNQIKDPRKRNTEEIYYETFGRWGKNLEEWDEE